MLKNILSLLVALYPTIVHAGASESMFMVRQDSIPLSTVEITSIRLLRHVIGQNQVIIDSLTLSSYQSRSISDLLSENTPLDIRIYGHGLSTTSTRGGGSSHTAVLWNGINIQNSMSGILDPSLIPLSGIGKIGYKNGGESALFGGGALTGVLFFDHDIAQKSGFHGSINASFASFSDFRQQGHLSIGNGRLATQISFLNQQASNDFPFRNTAAIGHPIQNQVNAALSAQSILHSMYMQLKPRTVVKTHIWFQNMWRQIAPTMTAADSKAIQDDRSWRGLVEIAHQTKRQGAWHGRIALTEDLLLYRSEVVTPSDNHVQNKIAELEYEGRFSKRWAYRAGTNFTQSTAKSNNYLSLNHRDRLALFLSQTIDISTFKLGINLRQEMVNSHFTPTTASIGLEKSNKVFKNTYETRWRGSVSRNYNLPALNDLYWVALGNPDLMPEHGWSGELGFDLSSISVAAPTIWTKALHLTIYTMQIQDRILWAPGNDGVWHPSNLFQSTSKGLEIAASGNTKLGWGQVRARAGYQYCAAVDKDGFQLIYVPKHQGNATFTASNSRWSLQWRQIFGGSRFMNSDNSSRTKAFLLSNVEIQWQPRLRHHKGSLTFLAQNLFNTDYQVIQYYAMPRRSFRLQAGIYF